MTRPSILTACLLGCVVAVLASPGWAGPRVDASRCPGLDGAEVARLLELEVSTSRQEPGELPAFDLALSCGHGVLTMSLTDPTTSKRLSRSIPAPALGPGGERVVALAASQLLVASWMELLMKLRSPEPSEPVPPPKPSPSAERMAARRAESPQEGASARLGAYGGLTFRDFRTPLMLYAAGVSATVRLSSSWAVRLEAGFEHGVAERESGSVGVWLSAIGVGAGWRAPLGGHVEWEGFALAGPAFGQLNGQPGSGGYVGKTATSVSGEAWIRTGPSWQTGSLRLSLSGCAGVLAVAPGGQVAGARPVRLDGGWFGGLLEGAWSGAGW